jgi:hypothetical protein
MDNSLNPIEDFINTGLADRFYKTFAVPLLFYNGPDVKAVVSAKLRKELKDCYPFARARTTGFAVNEATSYKPNTLARRGLHGNSSHDFTLTYKLELIPVITTYEIELYVQDMRSLRLLSKKWLLSSIKNDLKFSVTYGVAAIDIDVKLQKDLSIPSREGGVTEIKEYIMTSNLTVNGYMSNDLKTSQAAVELDIEGQVAQLGTEDANTQVFLFKNAWPDVNGPDASVGDDPTT